MITIHLTGPADVPVLLDTLRGIINAFTPQAKTAAPTKAETVTAPAVETPVAAPAKDKAPTLEEVRAAVQAKAAGGKRDAVKKLLSSFNVAKVTDLNAASYTEFMAKLEEL